MQEALNRWFIENFVKDLPLTYRVPKSRLCNSYTMGCPPVRGDNPRA